MSVYRLTIKNHHKTNLRLFVTNSSTTHTHFCHMRICERATASSIGIEGLVLLEYVASIIGQVLTSRIGGLHMQTTEPVGIIASRRSRVRSIGSSHLVTDGSIE